jgi:hypothetical protein
LTAIHEALADIPAFAVVLLAVAIEPIFHKFMKVSSVFDDFKGVIMTDLQMTYYFISSHLSVLRIITWTQSTFSSAVVVEGHPHHSASVTLVIQFLSIYSNTLPCGKAQFPYG